MNDRDQCICGIKIEIYNLEKIVEKVENNPLLTATDFYKEIVYIWAIIKDKIWRDISIKDKIKD